MSPIGDDVDHASELPVALVHILVDHDHEIPDAEVSLGCRPFASGVESGDVFLLELLPEAVDAGLDTLPRCSVAVRFLH